MGSKAKEVFLDVKKILLEINIRLRWMALDKLRKVCIFVIVERLERKIKTSVLYLN
jgi:hypothetical protein